jgi:broad specificity phosphatase PhoE
MEKNKMGYPNRLVLVRHAESEGNLVDSTERTRMAMGTNLYPLTPRGRMQATITAKWLSISYDSFDVMYSSYYTRAMETSKILIGIMSADRLLVDPRLVEAQRGMYHNLSHKEIAEKYPDEHVRRNKEGLYHYRPWGGENWPDVELRLLSFMQDMKTDRVGQDIILVGHGHTFLLLQRLFDGFPPEEALARYLKKDDKNGDGGVMSNAAVTEYRFDGNGPRLVLDNFVPWKDQL